MLIEMLRSCCVNSKIIPKTWFFLNVKRIFKALLKNNPKRYFEINPYVYLFENPIKPRRILDSTLLIENKRDICLQSFKDV